MLSSTSSFRLFTAGSALAIGALGAVGCMGPAAPYAGAPTTRLTIETDNPERPARVEVSPSDDDERVVAACPSAPCELRLPEGGYRLRVDGIDDTPSRSRWIDVRGPRARVQISPGSWNERVVGLILGILGPVSFVGGLSASIGDTCQSAESPDTKCSRLPAVMMVGGLVMTIVGWVMYGDGKTGVGQAQPFAARGDARSGALLTF